MMARVFKLILLGLGLAASARGEDTLTSRGVTYRIIGVNSTYLVTPLRDTTSRLSEQESLARCDELVAAVLARAATGGRRAEFVRDRIYSPPRGRGWVDYSQRHQGYRVMGAGARVNRDESGRIFLMGLEHESREFPAFVPRDTTALRKVAERAVPRAITGAPLQSELFVDPGREHPPRLVYLVLFPVRDHGRDSGWQVQVDAVSGEVVDSRSTFMNVPENLGTR